MTFRNVTIDTCNNWNHSKHYFPCILFALAALSAVCHIPDLRPQIFSWTMCPGLSWVINIYEEKFDEHLYLQSTAYEGDADTVIDRLSFRLVLIYSFTLTQFRYITCKESRIFFVLFSPDLKTEQVSVKRLELITRRTQLCSVALSVECFLRKYRNLI